MENACRTMADAAAALDPLRAGETEREGASFWEEN